MKKIFLIDDDTDDRELFENAIHSLGLHVKLSTANDGEQALSMLLEKPADEPDYIFLDLNMPRMTGLQLLQEMRNRNILPQTPVFIYTTSSGGYDVNKCCELGGKLVTKHSSFHDLCADITKLIA